MGVVIQNSMKLEMKGLVEDKKTEVLLHVLDSVSDNLIIIETKIREIGYSANNNEQSNEGKMIVIPKIDKDIPKKNSIAECEDECENIAVVSEDIDNEQALVNPELDLTVDLAVLKRSLPFQISQARELSLHNPLAIGVHSVLESLFRKVNSWTVNGQVKMKKENINVLTNIIGKIKKERQRIVKAFTSEKVVDLNLPKESGNLGSMEIGQLAETFIQTKSSRLKGERKVELLSAVILQALDEMESQKIEINDYRQAIDVLIKSSKHLNKLQIAWGELKDFFMKVSELLNSVKYNTISIKENKEILLDMNIDFMEILMDTIKEGVTEAYSQNIYVIKVASFYNEIMQMGLLKKIRGLNIECKTDKCLENTKHYIVKECKATQIKIREKVR